MSKKDKLLRLDYVKNPTSPTAGSFTFSGGSGTSSDAATKAELAAHAANPDAHHPQIHGLISSNHTASGLTTGHVLKATGATTFNFASLSHDELTGITENQHHNKIHDILGDNHTITAAAFSLVGTTATNTLGLLTATHSVVSPSAAESILKSSNIGGLYLRELGIGTATTARKLHIVDSTGAQMRLEFNGSNYMDFLVDGGGSWTIEPTGDVIFNPGGNDVRPENSYDLNLGLAESKWLTIHAAELWVDTLVAQDVISTIGGTIYVAPTSELTRDFGSVVTNYSTIARRGSTNTGSAIGSEDGYATITQRGTTNTDTDQGSSGGYSTIAQRGSTVVNSAYDFEVVVNKPTGTVENDVMLAIVGWWIGELTPPDDWIQIGSTLNWDTGGGIAYTAAFYKVAGSSEPANYTWTNSVFDITMVAITSYDNVDTTNPISAYTSNEATNTTSMTGLSLTPGTTADMLVFLGAMIEDEFTDERTVTAPSGMTELSDTQISETWTKLYVAEQLLSSGSATGNKTATISAEEDYGTFLVSLRPAISGASTSTATVTKPTGTIENDLMVAVVVRESGSLSEESGWTQIFSQSFSGASLEVYWKLAGASEPASSNWPLNNSSPISVSVSSFYNINISNPIGNFTYQANSNSTSMVAPSVTPVTTNDFLLFIGGISGNIRATAPAGMTEDVDFGLGNTAVYVAKQLLSGSSATGNKTATLASSSSNAGGLITIRPSGSSGTNSSVTITKPTGVVLNDLMLVTVIRTGGNLDEPDDWAQILYKAFTGGSLEVYYKIAGSSEPASYDWPLNTTDALLVSISAYDNVDVDAPFDVFNIQANASSTSMTSPSVTTTVATDRLVFIGGVGGNYRATAPSGMSEQADFGIGNIGSYYADVDLSVIGDTGTKIATLTNAAANAAAVIALRPDSTTASETTMYVKFNNLNNGDICMFQARMRVEFIQIASSATEITPDEEYSYTVIRNLDGTGSNDWIAGDAIVNQGQTDLGWIELYSRYGQPHMGQSATQRGGPTIVGNVRNSNIFNDFRERWAVGNLNGLYDFSNNIYGAAFGDPEKTWISVDDRASNGGLRFMNNLSEIGYIRNDATWKFNGDGDNYIEWNGTFLQVSGFINVIGGNASTIGNQTGGINLVYNSSFEIDSNSDGIADGFTKYDNGGGTSTALIVDGSKSRKAQRISWTGTNTTTKGIRFNVTNRIGTDYVLSFWARTNTAVEIRVYHDFPFPETIEQVIWPQANTTWQFYIMRVSWTSTPNSAWYISIENGASIANGWIEIDNIMLVEGDNPAPWNTSPNDIVDYGGRITMPYVATGSGLYLNSSYLGFWDGSAWRTYLDNQGNFFFGASGSNYIGYDTAENKLRGVGGGITQWYTSGADGKIYAGAGNVIIDSSGLAIKNSGYEHTQNDPINNSTSLRWINPDGNYAVALTGYRWSVKDTGTFNAVMAITARDDDGSIHTIGRFERFRNIVTPSDYTRTTIYGVLKVDGRLGLGYFEPTLNSPWINWSSSWAGFGYHQFGNMITFKGLVYPTSNQSAGTVILTLPAAFRPAKHRMFNQLTSNASGYVRVEVRSTGDIIIQGAINSGEWVSLDFNYVSEA